MIEYEVVGSPRRRDSFLYRYTMAGNGVFVDGDRPEFWAQFPIGHAAVRGLEGLAPVFDWRLPRVPKVVVQRMVTAAIGRMTDEGVEELYWLSHSELNPWDKGWLLTIPEQERSVSHCRPVDGQEDAHRRAIIECHSHHQMNAKFSRQDDDEETGFRIYAVVGRLHRQPLMRVRVGVYGLFWEIPAELVFELPDGLQCAVTREIEMLAKEGA